VIESVVLRDNRSVLDFLGEGHPPEEIGTLAGEGIRQEGLRCLNGQFESEEGRVLFEEMTECDSIPGLLRTSAAFYTRNTFLYRRVNEFLRSSAESDVETGRNLGLYIGLLRECFCVRGGLNPLSWDRPHVVYRGADFGVDVVADYARRPDEEIRWQGFASSSRDRGVALSFPGTVLFEISLLNPVASLDDISAFRHEQEVILSPYQCFDLKCVRWDQDCGRWILSVDETEDLPEGRSWFGSVRSTSPA
jgi:hypothetical protein